MQYILVSGNPLDGFTFHGPFPTADDASQFGDDAARFGDEDDAGWAAPLQPGCQVTLTEHVNRDSGEVVYGAECTVHGDLLAGDWHERGVMEAERDHHLGVSGEALSGR